MKKIVAIGIASVALSAHANQIYVDSPVCHSASNVVHGVCVQNKIGDPIAGKLIMIEEIFYLNGDSSYGIHTINTLHDNHYLDFFYTNEDFEKQKIEKVVYAVDYDGTPIPGCIFQLTRYNPDGKAIVFIQKNRDNTFSCSM
jgi:hypothetical protein